MSRNTREMQRKIIDELRVKPVISAEDEIEFRTQFLTDFVIKNNLQALVLGVSGGVDSLTAACIAQRAAERARSYGHMVHFFAMRLPYGVQRDEDAAMRSLEVIRPDRVLTTNIKSACVSMLEDLVAGGLTFNDDKHRDFIFGNIKARQRMIAQFAVAGAMRGIVIGTDQAAEACFGFFTKFGDGACDVTPLTGLTKRQVRQCAAAMGAPDDLVFKVPTADLEDLAPQKPDEDSFGVTYDELDDFLEGKEISLLSSNKIVDAFQASAHKRALPVSPF